MNFFFECALRVSAALAIGFVVTAVLRRAPAALRHIVWTAVFAVCAVTPVLFPWGPGIMKRLPLETPGPATVLTVATSHVVIVRATEAPKPASAIPYGRIALLIWMLGAAALSIRVVRSSMLIRALRRNATRLDTAEIAAAASLPTSLFEGIQFAESDAFAVALTMGIRAPAILLPPSHKNWSGSRLRSVLLHELAHVRRRDCLIQWLPYAICIAHWFNPLAWLARSQMLCEGERACDDAVLRGGASGAEFARDLFDLAQISGLKGADLMPTLLTKLERRITRLLDPSTNRKPLSRAGAVLAALAAGALLAPVAGVRAQNAAQTASLSGTVTDPSGAVVAGAMIELLGPAVNLSIKSDAAGAWTAANLPPGSYQLAVLVPGFATFRQNEGLSAGDARQLQQRLQVGQLSESMTVVAAGTPRPAGASVSGTPKRIRVGGNIQAAKLVNRTVPVYPDSARQQGREGTVQIQAIIGKTGSVQNAYVVGGREPDQLAEAALDAVRTWQYQPTLLNGEPVEVLTTITVNFQLR